uniref:uroporphyrinogen decarboxylase n=1 Tax=Pararhizobium sp. IMCC3301 TaxID=3067904 RepID=UPI0027406BA0|nr:uroporphyrinogen decarboxylase [Pararhizobium sp. IMCC3301]
MNKCLLQVLQSGPEDDALWPPPIWMMRQAGRYLPEYRKTRAEAGSFLDLCYSPKFAKEVTLQPIRRFGFDGAILFSDILVVPDALGRKVSFESGVGPRLDPINPGEIVALSLNGALDHLQPVLQAVSDIRAALPAETTLLGFCGAPWTVATYMVAGRGTSDQAPTRVFVHKYRAEFRDLIEVLTAMSIEYLSAQIEAGADAVQVFDSWSGILGEADFIEFCLEPMKQIVAGVKARHPGTPVIGFPKGASLHYERYVRETGIDCVGLDWTYPMALAKQQLSSSVVLQGNLDPTRLVAGGTALHEGISDILDAAKGARFVFNLGHGITPETPVDHVSAMIEQVRAG